MRKLLGAAIVGLVTLAASAQWMTPQQASQTSDTPAYCQTLPKTPQEPILSGKQLTGAYFAHPYQVTVYKMAARIPNVLFQQPCYCRCDREMGHGSLHSCFSGLHGAACSTCMKEAMYSYQQTRLGKTPTQIRTGIERGEFMKLDLEAATL